MYTATEKKERKKVQSNREYTSFYCEAEDRS